MKQALHFAAVVATAFLSAACARTGDSTIPTELPSGSASSGSQTAAPTSLVGPTWRLVSLAGRETLPGTRVTAAFAADDRVSGSAGCNGYFGRASVTDARLEVGRLGSTLMYCGADGVMAQEKDFLAAMEKATSYRVVNGQLQLGPAQGAVTLVFRVE